MKNIMGGILSHIRVNPFWRKKCHPFFIKKIKQKPFTLKKFQLFWNTSIQWISNEEVIHSARILRRITLQLSSMFGTSVNVTESHQLTISCLLPGFKNLWVNWGHQAHFKVLCCIWYCLVNFCILALLLE